MSRDRTASSTAPSRAGDAPEGDAGSSAESDSSLAWATMAFVIVIWGLGPPISKLISAPPVVTASVRFWVSVPIVYAAALAAGRRITWETIRHTWLAGALFGLNMVSVFVALQHATVAVLSIMMAMQPGVVLVLAGRFMGERAGRWHVSWMVVGIAGVCIVILGNGPEVEISGLGILFGLFSVLTFTGYYLINRSVRSKVNIHPLEWMTGSTIFSAITVTPVALAFTDLDGYRELGGMDFVYLFYVAGVVGIFSHTLMSWVHRFIPATRSSLAMLGMTVVAVTAAWPIKGEPVTVQQALGALVVLGAVGAVISRPAVSADAPARRRARAGRGSTAPVAFVVEPL